MIVFSRRDRACFETTRRLLAQIVNEGLVAARVDSDSGELRWLVLSSVHESLVKPESWVKASLVPDTYVGFKDEKAISLLRPENLQPQIMIGDSTTERDVLDPEVIFDHIRPWFSNVADEAVLKNIGKELRNSCGNQEKWLEISELERRPWLGSRSVDWEKALVFGHPSHPYHRLCYAQTPLKPHRPEDIPGMLTPSVAFVSIPRSEVHTSGLFEETLAALLTKLGVPNPTNDRLIVPCLAQQIPAVHVYFPNAIVVKIVSDCADAQASMRTLTVRPELSFAYHIKLSLACNITSALRTITPWTTMGSPIFTDLLEKLLPPDLWVFREVGSVTGSQKNFDIAKHLSCILREDLEARARANNETLIPAAALAHKSPDINKPYAQVLFGLDTLREKRLWFRRYISCLFKLTLPPLIDHGVGLEAHGQNIVARICIQTKEVKGFAVRDFGGIRLHVPTLQQYRAKLESLPSGSATMTDSLYNVWSKVHHSLLQNHVGSLLVSLGLEREGGWAIVREELSAVLQPDKNPVGQRIHEFFLGDTMPFKCFMRMRIEGKYRDYVERDLPNVLLLDSPQWATILKSYKPALHRT